MNWRKMGLNIPFQEILDVVLEEALEGQPLH